MRMTDVIRVATVLLAFHGVSLHAADPAWLHLSSKTGDLPVPGKSTQQTAALVADLDRRGKNGFVLAFRAVGPALVWYRPAAKGWDRIVVEPEYLTVEAGGAVHDIDGDGWPDLVFGGDYQSNCVWWWRNPGKDWQAGTPWERHTIKKVGKTQHHDQCIADFKGPARPSSPTGTRGPARSSPPTSRPTRVKLDAWPAEQVFSGSAGESPGKYAEGMSSFDIDGDGRPEILAGNHTFSYEKSGKWRATRIGDIGGLIFAGRFIRGAKIPQVVIAPGDGSGPVKWYECQGDPSETKNWTGHDLVGRPMIHPHSLQVADIDGDGNLDIFVAEMAKWTERQAGPRQPRGPGLPLLRRRQGGLPEDRIPDRHGLPRGPRRRPERRRPARHPEQALQLGDAAGGHLAQPRAWAALRRFAGALRTRSSRTSGRRLTHTEPDPLGKQQLLSHPLPGR